MMRSEQIKTQDRDWSTGIHYYFIINHAPTAKKIPENQQKEMYGVFIKPQINILFKIMNNLVSICFQAE